MKKLLAILFIIIGSFSLFVSNGTVSSDGKCLSGNQFKFVYDSSVEVGTVVVDYGIIHDGSVVQLYDDETETAGIYEVAPGETGRTIRTSEKELDGRVISVKIIENVKG